MVKMERMCAEMTGGIRKSWVGLLQSMPSRMLVADYEWTTLGSIKAGKGLLGAVIQRS